MKSFRYVEIPAEIHEEVKEHVMTYKDDEAVQCLVQHLQKVLQASLAMRRL